MTGTAGAGFADFCALSDIGQIVAPTATNETSANRLIRHLIRAATKVRYRRPALFCCLLKKYIKFAVLRKEPAERACRAFSAAAIIIKAKPWHRRCRLTATKA